MPNAPVQLLTVIEVARLMHVSKNKVYDLIAQGEIRAVDIGHGRAKTRIRADDYQAYIDAHTRRAPRRPDRK